MVTVARVEVPLGRYAWGRNLGCQNVPDWVVVTQLHTHVKNHQTVYLRCLHFIKCKIYLKINRSKH